MNYHRAFLSPDAHENADMNLSIPPLFYVSVNSLSYKPKSKPLYTERRHGCDEIIFGLKIRNAIPQYRNKLKVNNDKKYLHF